MIHTLRTRVQNAMRVASSAQVDVVDLAFDGLCSGLAVLTEEQKDAGALVIDLGAGTTDFVVHVNKAVAHAGSLSIGGDHVTNDIAMGLNIAHAQAEQLKCEHGQAMIDLARRGRQIRLEASHGFGERVVKLMQMDSVVHARLDELFQLIRDELSSQRLLPHLGAGILLVGGGSKMAQIDKLAEQVFALPAKRAKPLFCEWLNRKR